MVRVVIALLFLLMLFLLMPSIAHAQKRVALVVGNSAYQHTGKLTNPRNDATDVAAVFKKHGFQVLEGFDLDKAALDRKIRDFATALSGAEAGVFFYAGHGLQVGGQNYLVPVDAQLATGAALDFETVRLDLVHRTMEREATTNILFLDACRDNPLSRNLARAMGTRSADIGHGLAAVESGVGTLISFSTQPGNVALDGAGRNSPFASALVKHLSSSSDDLSAILISVRNDVMKDTQRKQVPWEHSALTGRFFFGGTQPSPKAPAAQLDKNELERAWAFIKNTDDQSRLEEFIKQFSDTPYAPMARTRLEELKTRQAAVASPPQARSQPAPTPSWSSPVAVRETLYQTIMSSFSQRIAGRGDGESVTESYREHRDPPKAMAICIDWTTTTPTALNPGQSNASYRRSGNVGCRGLSPKQCGQSVLQLCEERGTCKTRGQKCLLIDINGRNEIVLDDAWVKKFLR
jgi:Caspase domain